ncbi:glutathione S-transferase family protein [Sphingomonas sp.]|uniref:glutathione S-transferase family protein n=1 Tax=Sphingomonas sp. TaxID=28214 RepID=UPI002600862E|nr:glutathione S-transferase family protein [Sphingomonas sp.]
MSGLILHEDCRSGNCYKIRLTAAHLGIELERKNYDILKGETRTPEYLRDVNANGRIPVLQDGDRFLPESNAICFYLANGSKLIPDGHFDQADMLRWMFWEQYSHEPNIATLRFWLRFIGLDALTDAQRMQITGKRENGLAALDLMDRYLADRKWFVADQFSLADICLFAYTHVADEANFDLEAYPEIIRWMERIMTMDEHVGLDD